MSSLKVEDFHCAFCNADAGEPCQSRHGVELNYPHKRRREALNRVNRDASKKRAALIAREPSWVRRLFLRVTSFV